MAIGSTRIRAPHYPIIYIRGYAFSQDEIEATTEDPYMGFNLGATKLRLETYGEIRRHLFEGPLVRLMKDYGYRDIYAEGREIGEVPPRRAIVIYRYYEKLDSELGQSTLKTILAGDIDGAPMMEERARGLAEQIHALRALFCGDDEQLTREFRVNLVAHSMGGLICRCLLQKHGDLIRHGGDSFVHKVFTYATPHNGIEMFGWNLAPKYFRRGEMAEYLAISPELQYSLGGAVNTLDNKFDERRMFCLVGTNHKDYTAGFGFSRVGAGEMSDGLVAIKNATVRGVRHAFVHRSHSGAHGIVNSEEGYQNLIRFLFGKTFVDGGLQIQELPLLPLGGDVSLEVEAKVALSGKPDFNLTERSKTGWSTAVRTSSETGVSDIDEMVGLFSLLLLPEDLTGGSAEFCVDIAISPTVPIQDGIRQAGSFKPNQYLFRKSMVVRIDADTFRTSYVFDDESAFDSEGLSDVDSQQDRDDGTHRAAIVLTSPNGFRAILSLTIGRETEDEQTPEPAENLSGSDTGTAAEPAEADVATRAVAEAG